MDKRRGSCRKTYISQNFASIYEVWFKVRYTLSYLGQINRLKDVKEVDFAI